MSEHCSDFKAGWDCCDCDAQHEEGCKADESMNSCTCAPTVCEYEDDPTPYSSGFQTKAAYERVNGKD
jgi:hypothetical protein